MHMMELCFKCEEMIWSLDVYLFRVDLKKNGPHPPEQISEKHENIGEWGPVLFIVNRADCPNHDSPKI